jgi:hypothetical protein
MSFGRIQLIVADKPRDVEWSDYLHPVKGISSAVNLTAFMLLTR